MSRKRTSTSSAAEISQSAGSACSNNSEEYEYEYYRPGCYCTPQVVRHATPYTCAYLHEYPPQWSVCSPATYVVDAYGMVYYLSDFEHQFHLPSMTVETESTYHYYDRNDFQLQVDENEDEDAVSPRKRERFECDNDEDGETSSGIPAITQGQTIPDVGTSKKTIEGGNVYRSEEGYLVEEPIETDESQPK